MKRIGEGMVVIGLVAIGAMIVVAFVSRSENGAVVITAILGFAATTIGGMMALLRQLEKVEDGQLRNAKQLGEVQDRQIHNTEQMKEVQQTTKSTHKLANSAFREQLLLTLTTLERLAASPLATPKDRQAVDKARKLLREYDEQC